MSKYRGWFPRLLNWWSEWYPAVIMVGLLWVAGALACYKFNIDSRNNRLAYEAWTRNTHVELTYREWLVLSERNALPVTYKELPSE